MSSGPQVRPRPGPLLFMLACTAVLLGGLLLFILLMLTNHFVFPWWGMLALLGLLMAATQHAYWGAPWKGNTAASAWQLWREPQTRNLPVLPPLPLWKVALIYLGWLGLTAVIAFTFSKENQRRGQQQSASFNESSWLRSASKLGFVHVSCRDFPDTGLTSDSRCYIWPGASLASGEFKALLSEWVRDESGAYVNDHWNVPLFELPAQTAGGAWGGNATVRLRVWLAKEWDQELRPYRLNYLTRTGLRGGPVPAPLQEKMGWLRAQVFPAYFTFTPLK
ncbi:hypothetical protein [Deinococcus hohokamensis]|uniref:Uncharacterized protein n=1 Tax=Deinococcus hohokamensis TaxID=309883 RepID=A0ABV9IAN9_9DEIO